MVQSVAVVQEPPSLRLLGGFRVFLGGAPAALPAQGRLLLGYLAIRDHEQPRDRVAERLWADSPPERARACLRTVLWRIRGVSRDLVRSTHDSIALGPSVRVDVSESRRVEERIFAGDLPNLPLAQVIALLGADLLPGWAEDWLLLEQERQRQRRVHALEALSCQLIACGQYAHAIDAAQAAIVAEPLRESAHLAVIQAHLTEGNVGAARRQYLLYRQLLRDELQMEPSEEMTALVMAEVDPVSRAARPAHRVVHTR